MSSSASGPEDSAGTPQPSPSPARPASEQTPDPALLEEVLRQTSEIYDSDEPLEEADREALLEVARRHRAERLLVDPVVVELVQAVLRTHFPALPSSSPHWEAISVRIAQTLFDDPLSHGRLQAFWVRLKEMT